MKFNSAFEEWLHQPNPDWKINLEICDENVFRELRMERKRVEEILEKLQEYGIFNKVV